MERNISSLVFNGSIPEAIAEARTQKKLFVVYISGKSTESAELENSTWADSNVGDCIAKYCILLYILEGSTDDANFSAIYPHTSTPCISVIGYNGVQFWQNEGLVSADVLVSSIQKAWLSLHIQETAASIFTTALSSENPNPSALPASNMCDGSSSSNPVAASEEGSSSTELMIPSKMQEEQKGHEGAVQGTSTGPSDFNYTMEVNQDEPKVISGQHSDPLSKTEGEENVPFLVTSESDAAWTSQEKTVESSSQTHDTRTNSPGSSSEGTSQLESHEARVVIQDVNSLGTEQKDTDRDSKDASPTDLCLNIRLPNGANLQAMFPKTSSLMAVKDFVDHNRTDGSGTYELAIPYPRKVFKDTDLSRSLIDLGLTNRQALIVVPLRQAMSRTERSSANPASVASYPSTLGDEESFPLWRRVLSYVNPLSYLGSARSSTSSDVSETRTLASSPSSTSQNIAQRYNAGNSQSSSTSTARRNNGEQKPTSGFGSNIHTLKHDEDDAPFGDRNAFWNGNSTQYGGNDENK